jgi:RES domain-containing protein
LTTVYRIGYCDTPAPALNVLLMSLGYGSTQGNGRWHTKGPNQVVYCCSSRALCQLEKRVHANGVP